MKLYKNTFILFFLIIIPMLQSFISKFDISTQIPFFKNLDELALLFLINLAVKGYVRIIKNKWWLWIVVFFMGYLLQGVLSATISGVGFVQVSHQVVISLKFLYVIFVLVGLNNPYDLFEKYLNFSKYVLFFSIPIVLFQFMSPSIYDAFFSNGLHSGTVLFSGGIKITRGAGFFTHPGQMAVYTASLSICYFYIYFSNKVRVVKHVGWWFVISSVLLIVTFQRLEIAATIFVLTVVFFLTEKGRRRLVKYSVGLLFVCMVLIMAYPILKFIYNQSAIDGIMSSADPRIVFYVLGVEIANDYFPFGSGLGTYGGFVAANYDSLVYLDYGYQDYYWYLQGNFLADTFWAHILGETGYLGLLFYLLSLSSIIVIALKYLKLDSDSTIIRIVIALTLFILINSLATPDMVSILSLSQCFIAIGCLFYLRKNFV